MNELYLASGSPRRLQILEEAGYVVDVRPQSVNEAPLPGEHPLAVVSRLAKLKAASLMNGLEGGQAGDLIVAADTVVWLNRHILEKPANDMEAHYMLSELSGKSHYVSTGVAVAYKAADDQGFQMNSFVQTTKVTFYPLSEAEIQAYIATGEGRDKAGAYGIQGLARLFVKSIEGDYFNVVGLPIAEVVREIQKLTDPEAEDVEVVKILLGAVNED